MPARQRLTSRLRRYGPPLAPAHRPSARGQSLVEFALILPMLIVLLLGVADFGRVFHAGVVTQSSVRAAAEIAALEYLRNPPSIPGDDAYYVRLHEIAAETLCEEMRTLPTTTYTNADLDPQGECPEWPAVAVCVHDGSDTRCDGSAPSDFTAGPAECANMDGGWNPATDAQGHTYVEVRACYRFTTLINLQLALPMNTGISIGEIYLQKQAFFVVADY